MSYQTGIEHASFNLSPAILRDIASAQADPVSTCKELLRRYGAVEISQDEQAVQGVLQVARSIDYKSFEPVAGVVDN